MYRLNLLNILKKSLYISLLLLLVYFSILMVNLLLPYLSFRTDVAFLQIKQWVFKQFSGTVANVWIVAFYSHVLTSLFALLAGFTQFSKRLKHHRIHRVFGYTYIITILFFTGPSGLIMGLLANGGIWSVLSFTILAVLWWYFTYVAFIKAKRKDFKAHQKFMIRSFALTLSAITLRLWKFTITNYIYEMPPMDLYRLVAWLGWVPNLLVAELIIRYFKFKK